MTRSSVSCCERLAFLTILLLSSACGPTLYQRAAPYPAWGQSPEQFARDHNECAFWASKVSQPPGAALGGGALAGALVGAAAGAALGAALGVDPGQAAGVGAAAGGFSGAGSGAASLVQQQFEAYRNCMLARGYVVGGAVPPPPATVAQSGSVPLQRRPVAERVTPEDHSVENRLLLLRQLRQEGLITNKEYRDQRQAIIDSL